MPFSHFGLDPRLLEALSALGFEKPTPIQTDAIPQVLAGRDVLACAATGSGKTAAFLLPVLNRLLGGNSGRVRALVLTPTRELAAQVDEHRAALAARTPLRGAAVYGGVGMGPQEEALRRGVDVLVATPGRLLDHLQQPYARLDGLEVLVLDEADRMLDMGFLPDVQRILSHLPKGLQVLLFSATIPPPIAQLAREIQTSPVALQVERRQAPAKGIAQAVWPVAPELKAPLLLELLRRGGLETALVFTRTKHRANRVAEWLAKRGVAVERIHGNRSQSQRGDALAGFKRGRFQVLVATDIAARGLDIEGLPHVVNFDVPAQPDDYIHRVGRTARAEREGDAWTFVAPHEEADLAAIERAVGHAIPRRRLDGFDYASRVEEKLEVPIAERIAAIRARKAEERRRAAEKAARRAEREAAQAAPLAAKGNGRSAAEGARRPAGASGGRGERTAGAGASTDGRGSGRPRRSRRAGSPPPQAARAAGGLPPQGYRVADGQGGQGGRPGAGRPTDRDGRGSRRARGGRGRRREHQNPVEAALPPRGRERDPLHPAQVGRTTHRPLATAAPWWLRGDA